MTEGGRYDGLLKHLWPDHALAVAASPSAVGLTLNVKLLLPFMGSTAIQTALPVSQVKHNNTSQSPTSLLVSYFSHPTCG